MVVAGNNAILHFMGNQYIDLEEDADEGHVETWAVAYHMRPENLGADDLILGLHYCDDVARFDDGWRSNQSNRNQRPPRVGPARQLQRFCDRARPQCRRGRDAENRGWATLAKIGGMAQEGRTEEWSRPVAQRRAYVLAAELPALMADPCPRGKLLPINQLVKDWFNPLADRQEMVASPLSADCPQEYAVRIATVVHALCDQSGLEVPAWVFDHRFERDEMLVEAVLWDTEMGEWEREHAPEACLWHRCWFGEEYLEVLGVHVG